MPGFQFSEEMSGNYALVDTPYDNRSIRFQVNVVASSLLQYARTGLCRMSGTLDMDGFATGVPLEGTLELRPFIRRIIGYDFDFTADDGSSYRFTGRKQVRLRHLRTSLTTLPASITAADGSEVATGLVCFNLAEDLLDFATSWRAA